jgi:hypothetical protein
MEADGGQRASSRMEMAALAGRWRRCRSTSAGFHDAVAAARKRARPSSLPCASPGHHGVGDGTPRHHGAGNLEAERWRRDAEQEAAPRFT